MKVWTVREFGPFRHVLRLEKQPLPAVTNGCALIQVRAADINFPDLLMIAGKYQVRPELPFTPGLAAAGELVEGGQAAGLTAGDRVVCPLPFGGFREYLCVPPQHVFPIPPSMSETEAAAFFLIFQTAWFALRKARLAAGETLLVHAGASGVGTAAIQYGKALGAIVIATAGGAEKVELCQRLGVDLAIDSSGEDFVAAVQEFTQGGGADVIFDPVGGDVLDRSLRCIAWEGRILPIGFTSGNIPAIRANRVLLKNIAVLGMYWTTYWTNAPQEVRRAHGELVGLYEQGRIAPVIDRLYPLEELPQALAALERRECRGKVVLAVDRA
jgi:NADPH2:quinone reductase